MRDILSNINDKELQSKVLQVKNLTSLKINSTPELKKIYEEIKNTDDELYEHSMTVAEIACILGVLYNLRLDELLNLYIGGVFHDNGKTLLNQDILYKAAKFSADERQLIEAHTCLGYKRMKKIVSDKIILDIVLKHHERINNSGYPNGLNENEQSLFVKIVAVADVFQALTSKRCYKEPMEAHEAFKIMEKDKGLDQIIITILKSILL